MTIDNIVFLICSERSGSNLVRVMAGAHPQIEAPPPLHLWRDLLASPGPLYRDGAASAHWPVIVERIRRALSHQYDDSFSEVVLTAIDALPEPTMEAVIRCIYRHILERSGKPLLLIKENNLQDYAAEIMHSFPQARFVFQVRDPRDVIASGRKLRKGRLGNKFGSVLNAIDTWKHDQEFGLKLQAFFGDERVYYLRYEDLVARPQPVLQGMCDFLQIEYSDAMLDYHSKDENLAFADKGKQWKNISRPVIQDNTGNYRKTLSRREIRSIELYLAPLLRRFDYPLDNRLPTKPGWMDLSWPRLMHILEYRANKIQTPYFFSGNNAYLQQLVEHSAPLLPRYRQSNVESANNANENEAGDEYCIHQLLQAARDNWQRPALQVRDESWSYAELLGWCTQRAQELATAPAGRPAVIGVYAQRHWSAYAGILTALLLGAAYVPLNPSFPPQRNRHIIERAGVTDLVFAQADSGAIDEITGSDNTTDGAPARHAWPDLKADCQLAETSDNPAAMVAPEIGGADIAYILFTSGSTGEPKGVGISQANLAAYLHCAQHFLHADCDARFSQTFDLTFDLSVHDLFVCWTHGAELIVPGKRELLEPAGYLRDKRITHWFSVPSLASILRQQQKLQPDSFPELRSSLFCGEALSRELAADWLTAAPNSRVENWYGPTEATIACTRYVIDGTAALDSPLVSIGEAFPGMTTLIVDASDHIIDADETTGELLLGGRQLAPGYWNDQALTDAAFFRPEGYQERYYRSGDLVYRLNGKLYYVGRKDSQVKIRGYRVELSEIENVARRFLEGSNVVALSWPPGDSNGSYIVCAIENEQVDTQGLLDALRAQLPIYMIPSATFGFALFPKNASGKIDRRAIADEIAQRFAAQSDTAAKSSEDIEAQLMAAVCQIKTGLTPAQVSAATNLIDAGMDSLDFVSLMLVLEEKFAVRLDTEKVAQLSTLPFAQLVATVSNGGELPEVANRKQSRANRGIQFVHEFPGLLADSSQPLVLAVGSSGLFRGFNAGIYQQQAQQAGHDLRALNIGIAALSCAGLTRICRYLRDTMLARDCRARAIIYELDPLLISSLPPPGDIELDAAVFDGKVQPAAAGTLAAQFEWNPQSNGDVAFSEQFVEKGRRGRWESKRDFEIADTYAGRVEFDAKAIAAWFDGLHLLSGITDQLVCFVHPLNKDRRYRDEPRKKNRLRPVLERLEGEQLAGIMKPDDFDILESDYLNINHVTPQGSHKLTAQIFALMAALDKT